MLKCFIVLLVLSLTSVLHAGDLIDLLSRADTLSARLDIQMDKIRLMAKRDEFPSVVLADIISDKSVYGVGETPKMTVVMKTEVGHGMELFPTINYLDTDFEPLKSVDNTHAFTLPQSNTSGVFEAVVTIWLQDKAAYLELVSIINSASVMKQNLVTESQKPQSESELTDIQLQISNLENLIDRARDGIRENRRFIEEITKDILIEGGRS